MFNKMFIILSLALIVGCNYEEIIKAHEETVKDETQQAIRSISFKSDNYTISVGGEGLNLSESKLLEASYNDGTKKELTAQEMSDVVWDFDDQYVDHSSTTIKGLTRTQRPFVVTATYQDKIATTKLSVIENIDVIRIVPSSQNSIYVGQSITLMAIGTYESSNDSVDLGANLSGDLQWTVNGDDAHLESDAAGGWVFTPRTAGSLNVQVAYKGLSDDVNIPVKELIAEHVSIIPPSKTKVIVGEQLQLKSQLLDNNGQIIPYNVNWTTSNKEIATVEEGNVNFIDSGEVTITASFTNLTTRSTAITDSVTFNVEDKGEPTEVVTTASPEKAFVGQTITLTSTAVFNDSVTDVTNVAVYTANGATINNKHIFNKAGRYSVTSEYGNKSSSVMIDITEPTINLLSINVDLDVLMAGHKRPLRALAIMADDSVRDVSDVVHWHATGPATVINGEILANEAGTATITAFYNGSDAEPVTIEIKDDIVESLSFRQLRSSGAYFTQEGSFSLELLASDLTFDVIANFKEISLRILDPQDVSLTWKTNAGDLSASIQYIDERHFSPKFNGSGTGTLTATYGGQSVALDVTVEATRTVSEFYIAPATNTDYVRGSSYSHSAMLKLDNGQVISLNQSQVSWSVDKPSVATISSAGVVSYIEDESATTTENVVITGTYNYEGIYYTSTFTSSVLPYVITGVEVTLERPSLEFDSEDLYVDEIYLVKPQAVLSNGMTIALTLGDVSLSSVSGATVVLDEREFTVITRKAGKETVYIDYKGFATQFSVTTGDIPSSNLGISCRSNVIIMNNLVGASCGFVLESNRYLHPVTYSATENYRINAYKNYLYMINYFNESFVSGTDTIKESMVTFCAYNGECANRAFTAIEGTGNASDSYDGNSIIAKSNMSTTFPVRFTIGSVTIVHHDRLLSISMTPQNPNLGRFQLNTFYPEGLTGETEVDVYSVWGVGVNDFIKSTRTLKVVDHRYELMDDNTFYMAHNVFPSEGITISGLVTETLAPGTADEVTTDITSNLYYEAKTTGFEVIDGYLHYNGNSIPTEVNLNVVATDSGYTDVPEVISNVAINIKNLSSFAQCESVNDEGCVMTYETTASSNLGAGSTLAYFDESAIPLLEDFLSKVEADEDGSVSIDANNAFNKNSVSYNTQGLVSEGPSLIAVPTVNAHAAMAFCYALAQNEFMGKNNWSIPAPGALRIQLGAEPSDAINDAINDAIAYGAGFYSQNTAGVYKVIKDSNGVWATPKVDANNNGTTPICYSAAP